MSLPPAKQIVVITGMSGSGKSTAVRALEDAGWFCIDNLPAPLLPKVTELSAPGGEDKKLAFVIDVRELRFLSEAPRIIDEARRAGHQVDVLFLDSSDEWLIRRYSETRRRHPLAGRGGVNEGISRERAALKELREQAQHLLDTSGLSVHELRRQIQTRFGGEAQGQLALTLMSFGFKYGVPSQADLVLDVRFLPNPYFVPELKAFTGRDPKVASFVMDRPETSQFVDKTVDLLTFLLPKYQREGKTYLTVAIGCTGGKHRSVAVTVAIGERMKADWPSAHVFDRDLDKE
ncbi:MAG: putative P-loop-containing kinase [Myxococcaceae bacterium]|nr:putative P-loop-containing kinase [Myxococcaceae bacterium]